MPLESKVVPQVGTRSRESPAKLEQDGSRGIHGW